ncbi:MAG: YbhB/YbcL family Raf kinase inhibitor-like protein [Myxococcales bacterium]|nr:YbhB/YbcL family Raf kinase inhibitor-like protein [Myxococcales bacterium]
MLSILLAAGAAASSFTLTSPDVSREKPIGNKYVFNSFGCSGENVSPALQWKGAPKNTKSFALTVYDPDAPTGSGWWHWVVYNIPADTTTLRAGAGDSKGSGLPTGAAQGNTDFGQPGYGGPCPPPGKPHHYVFTLYALDTDKLDIPPTATAAFVGFNIHGHSVGKATFTATYGRK